MKTFGQIRIAGKKYWMASTKRKRNVNDITIDSLECKWQNNYVSNNKHNSFYCSIAEWNTHITDFLNDKNFDNFSYRNSKHNKALFRHYTRLLLIVSEIVTDFEDFIKHTSEPSLGNVRSMLSIPQHSFSVKELFNYINHICKHKTGNIKFQYHCLNHHVNYLFKDSLPKRIVPTLNIKNLATFNHSGSEPVEVPELMDILKQIIYCYECVDKHLEQNYSALKSKLAPYEKSNL